MADERGCPFQKNSDTLDMGPHDGYCELNRTHPVCNGKIKLCENIESLRRYVMERVWMKVRIKEEKTIAS